MNRLFVAAEIPERQLINIVELRNSVFEDNSRIRWEPLSKLHLTLKFLGDVRPDEEELLKHSLELAALNSSEVATHFTKFGLFYRNGKPAILWAGLRNSKELVELFNNVEKACEEASFKKEVRKFKPHITLARLKGSENMELINNFLNKNLPDEKFYISKINLVKSLLRPSGSVYTILKSFNLKPEE